ncbi:MAG: hypothetical protein OHK93_005225 [Ramalina farinacea]|uniref:AB hydrolase-1 domain-containing protein n=1 Tax=Ramalina farinacea TaxID=258253 RepID=A0AA43QXY3_9LECA|nr:hypothetical protein [Ramalina farinacea]
MDHLPESIQEALAFEKSNQALGSVIQDQFYDAPGQDDAKAAPGTLFKVEKDVDTSKFLLPATTALSRFVYQSETMSGVKTPVSAYVLWPYSPRSQSDGYSVVAWAHGTSGFGPNAAPSNHKNLWQHFQAPYQLALQGYLVVATDYAGLGVSKQASGESIGIEWCTGPSQANDVIYSVQAVQAAFPELSKQFVVIGQSQGGGAAWAVAQKAAAAPIPGYLGAVAVSPYTSLLKETNSDIVELAIAIQSPAMAAALPAYDPKGLLNDEGLNVYKTVYDMDGAIFSGLALLSGKGTLKSDCKENPHYRKFQEMTINGGKAIAGPLLVIHGKDDPALPISATDSAVEETAKRFPSSQIEYVSLPGVTHVSALSASQHIYMDWIQDRFAGREVPPGCSRHELAAARPEKSRQGEQNWYLSLATQPYHAPGP